MHIWLYSIITMCDSCAEVWSVHNNSFPAPVPDPQSSWPHWFPWQRKLTQTNSIYNCLSNNTPLCLPGDEDVAKLAAHSSELGCLHHCCSHGDVSHDALPLADRRIGFGHCWRNMKYVQENITHFMWLHVNNKTQWDQNKYFVNKASQYFVLPLLNLVSPLFNTLLIIQ